MNQHLSALAATAVTVLLASACAVVGQQTAGPGPKASAKANPVFSGQLTLAGGTYDHDIDGSIDDDTSAGFIGLLIEGNTRSGIGGGVSIEAMNSDDDLFEGQATNPSQASSFEIAPYFLYRLRAGNRFRMPIRIGPWVDALTLDDQGSSDSLTWVTFGLRAAVEPEVILAQTQDFEWSLFTAISVAGGSTVAHLETSTGDEDFDSDGGVFGFEIGPRFRWSHFFTSISFLHRSRSIDESDPENNVSVRGIDTKFDALAISFGGAF